MQTAEVVIIGGGIVGSSIAYHLTAAGCKDVLVIERESAQGKGSTGKSMGGVRAQFSTPINIQMSLYSIPFYARFDELLGSYLDEGFLVGITADHGMQAKQNPDGSPRVLRGIAIVREYADFFSRRLVQPLAHRLQLGELVLRQRLCREQVEGPAGGILQDRMQHRRVVAKRFARSGRRGDDHVPTSERMLDSLGLVRIELRNAARFEGRA